MMMKISILVGSSLVAYQGISQLMKAHNQQGIANCVYFCFTVLKFVLLFCNKLAFFDITVL